MYLAFCRSSLVVTHLMIWLSLSLKSTSSKSNTINGRRLREICLRGRALPNTSKYFLPLIWKFLTLNFSLIWRFLLFYYRCWRLSGSILPVDFRIRRYALLSIERLIIARSYFLGLSYLVFSSPFFSGSGKWEILWKKR